MTRTCIAHAKPYTLGEELFLVHLHRQTPEDSVNDRDHDPQDEPPRKRSRSLGDELWQIHVRRSQGVDLDRDEQEPEQKFAPKKIIKKKGMRQRKARPVAAHVIHLRNRDVPPPSSMVH